MVKFWVYKASENVEHGHVQEINSLEDLLEFQRRIGEKIIIGKNYALEVIADLPTEYLRENNPAYVEMWEKKVKTLKANGASDCEHEIMIYEYHIE